MSFDPAVLSRVLDQFSKRRRARRLEQSARREEIYRELPEIRELDARLSRGMLEVARAALKNGTDPGPIIRAVSAENAALMRRRADLLRNAGFSEDYLDPLFDCLKCGDTGYIGAEPCACLLSAYAEAQKKELSNLLDLRGQSFDKFDFNYYSDEPDPEFGFSPRQNIEKIYDFCADYACNFGRRRGSLFLSGRPGRGKTFLSCCIAGEVSARGFSVVYDTAIRMFERFEARHFGRDAAAESDVRRYMDCDLLIIDDLGTEFSSPFLVSALYDLINTRIITGKKTIINSNLTSEELARRYSPQIVSRLEGEYVTLYLIGGDIRQLIRREKGFA